MTSNKSRVVWALLVGGAIVSITTMQLTSAAAKPPDGRGGGNGGGNGGGGGGTPPAAVTDLAFTSVTHDSITIEWTASGNNGTEGTAAAYDIRYLIGEFITDANWDDANQVFATPSPQASGSAELFTIHRLMGGQSYDIGLKVINGGDTASELANLPDPLLPVTLIAVSGQWDPELVIQTSRIRHSDFDLHPTTDQPAIAYGDEFNDVLRFTYFDEVEGVWKSEVMHTGARLASVGFQYAPLGQLTAGQPTATISGSGITGLLFATRDIIDGWSFATVGSRNLEDGANRPVFDSAGNPSVVYRIHNVSGKGKKRTSSTSLHYAVRMIDGTWKQELIDASNSSRPSLVYDLDGNAAVSYNAAGADGVRELKLARRTEPEPGSWVWVLETVQAFSTATAMPRDTSLAFDSSGVPMIALSAQMDFSNPDGSTIHVARFVGGAWQLELVDPLATSAQKPILLFDSTSSPVIVYWNVNFIMTQLEMLMARFNGASWDIEVVDTSLNQIEWFTDVLNNVHFRFDALGESWVHFNIEHSASMNSINDELFLTRRVGN